MRTGRRVRLEYRVLGPFEVLVDRRALPLADGRHGAVVAALVLSANRVVSAESLADAAWGGERPEAARAVAHDTVTWFRQRLTEAGAVDVVEIGRNGYRLHIADGELDLHVFEQLIDLARTAAASGRLAEAATSLSQAFGLWRGSPLSGVPGRLAEATAAALASRRVTVAEEVIVSAARRLEPKAGTSPSRLSRREMEVVRFVAAGLTNTEIGRRLAISTRTVDSHVDHIKDKLGVSRRVQIAAWALGQRL